MVGKTTFRISPVKLSFFLPLIFVPIIFLGCTHGNCRSQQELLKNTGAPAQVSVEELSRMKEVSKGQKIKVFKADGSLQCQQGQKISLAEMEKSLQGIQVYSRTNQNDGKMRIQMCGAPTGNCNIYEIDRENLEKVLGLGFKEWLGSE